MPLRRLLAGTAVVTEVEHDVIPVRLPHGKQWQCSCGWAGTVVMYGDIDAHTQAAAVAVRHAGGMK